MYIRNINKFRAEKRYSAKTTSMDRKASGSSKKSCSSWDRAEIRAGLNKYLVKIRKYHEDPFLAETEEPTLFDIINMWKAEDRMAEREAKLQEEADKISEEIRILYEQRNVIEYQIAKKAQEWHAVFCMDDWCLDCTKSMADWVSDMFGRF